jgi:hypothetical protein
MSQLYFIVFNSVTWTDTRKDLLPIAADGLTFGRRPGRLRDMIIIKSICSFRDDRPAKL